MRGWVPAPVIVAVLAAPLGLADARPLSGPVGVGALLDISGTTMDDVS